MNQPSPRELPPFPTMRAAFVTSTSAVGEPFPYVLTFAVPTLQALHAAHREWLELAKFAAAAPAPETPRTTDEAVEDAPVRMTDEKRAERALFDAALNAHLDAHHEDFVLAHGCPNALWLGWVMGRAQANDDAEAESPIAPGWTYTVGDGHDGFGCYAHNTEYPEEGAVKIAGMVHPRGDVASPDYKIMHKTESQVAFEEYARGGNPCSSWNIWKAACAWRDRTMAAQPAAICTREHCGP